LTAPTLVLTLHGTRQPAGLAAALALRDAVAARVPGVDVELGWVDIHDTRLDATLAALGPAVVVPAFLTAGYHVDHDVARAIASTNGRAVAASHLGGDALDAVRDRLLEAGPLGDAVVLAAAGSKRPGAVAEVEASARRLSDAVGRPVLAGFFYSASPTPEEAVAALRARGLADVTVATYALLPGLYQARLAGLDVRAVAEPVGVHPRLVDSIVARYTAARPRAVA